MAERETGRAVWRYLRQQGRAGWILLLGALGLGLMLWSLIAGGARDSPSAAADGDDWQRYAAALEEKAAALCGQVAGVTDVTVAISLAQGVEYVYAEGEDGGYLTTGSGAAQSALLLTERPPQVSGIGVVCRGAEDPGTVQTLLSLLSAAFGVGSNRIFITAAG